MKIHPFFLFLFYVEIHKTSPAPPFFGANTCLIFVTIKVLLFIQYYFNMLDVILILFHFSY